MKAISIFACFLFSISLAAQCVKCHSFEEAFKKPEQVKSLVINPWQHGVTLDSIPDKIQLLTNLETLFLVDHEFVYISDKIGKLVKLKELSLADSGLKEIPESIFNLKQLKELIVWYNDFSEEQIEEYIQRFEKEMPNTKLRIKD